MEKIYQVEFLQYTNCMKNTVWNEEENNYLRIGTEPFLIRESEFEKYMKFGDGFRVVRFVGNLER